MGLNADGPAMELTSSDAGVDPYLVLIDLERFENVEEVEIEG